MNETFTAEKMAEFLGVEMGEEFQFCDENGDYSAKYRITKRGLEHLNCERTCLLELNFLIGKHIKKLPWKPKDGELYWYAYTDGSIGVDEFTQSLVCLALYAVGNCFRTKEEAEARKEEVITRLKFIYENGRDEQKSEKPSVEEAAKVLKGYCKGNDCSRCLFGKEFGMGCKLKIFPVNWQI